MPLGGTDPLSGFFVHRWRSARQVCQTRLASGLAANWDRVVSVHHLNYPGRRQTQVLSEPNIRKYPYYFLLFSIDCQSFSSYRDSPDLHGQSRRQRSAASAGLAERQSIGSF